MSNPRDYQVVHVKPRPVVPVLKRSPDVMVREIAIPGPAGPRGLPGADGKSGALAFSYPAGAAIGGHKVVTFDPEGALIYASADVLSHADRVVGVTTGAAEAGANVSVQRAGELSEPSWSWEPELPIYLGINGVMTQTPPTAAVAKFSLVIGVPVSPTAVFLNVGFPIVLI